eukprot:XP_013990415.1 PREDICTED: LOW QUALITY PROTEIN: eukaryotic translation initiation factor 2D-like [Salmo salar]
MGGLTAIFVLVPNKEKLNVVKIYAHKGDAVTLYVLHKNPVFFELEKRVYPTVYKLWRYPHVLPAFTTWPPVLQKLAGGADLMLPGVVVPPSGLPEVKKGDFCAVKVVSNRAPVAVGIWTATMSNAEMQGLGMKGRGVSIFHTYMDSLWTLDKMQHCHQLVFPGQPPIVKKGHIEPIDISVASRSSNKQIQP